MATDVSICSNACLMLGQDEIASLDPPDNTKQAKLCANIYPQVRLWVLRSHTWACTKKRVILSPDDVTPAFDWAYQFSFPDDWLRNIQIGYLKQPMDFVIEGRKFLCNETVFPLVYQFDNDNEATYDSMLVHVLGLAMQAILAYPITKSTSMRDACEKTLMRELRAARSVDGQDEPPDTLGDFRLLSVGLENAF